MNEQVERWLPTAKNYEEALKIATHEILHEVVNLKLGVSNTTFTEALFDVLCGREECGLWFGKSCYEGIRKVVDEGN